ncbi:mannose-6-phosphate isomerase, class I [Robertkochia marina]|uniref:mannose-6-phosphate isomerase, class I n=1 Tax=Robertkochia marina TaxID=1227945 RepID=UPI001454C3BD|nr:mannose-6-phosphate isomerase, class I [Robertkochia marina]
MKTYPLEGKTQSYSWGGTQFIPELLGLEKNGKPYAEYWLGTHERGQADIVLPKGKTSLRNFLNTFKSGGVKASGLSFLFKVLDVKNMLSIQVHPSKESAKKEYLLENLQGIPIDHPERNFKDQNHKPEIMVALSEFWLLHGFLSEEKLLGRLREVPEFHELIPALQSDGIKGLYNKVMNQDFKERKRILKPIIERILPLYREGILSKTSADYWAAKAFIQFEENGDFDKGIYSIYFFNLVELKPGEGIYQPTGVPHAYLEGQNVELMANSDNVLRGGLTSKHIDVRQLLKHTKFQEIEPQIIRGTLKEDGMERIYACDVPDFQLSQIQILSSEIYCTTSTSSEILLVMEGDVAMREKNGALLVLSKGQSAFVECGCHYYLEARNSAVIFKAASGKT